MTSPIEKSLKDVHIGVDYNKSINKYFFFLHDYIIFCFNLRHKCVIVFRISQIDILKIELGSNATELSLIQDLSFSKISLISIISCDFFMTLFNHPP